MPYGYVDPLQRVHQQQALRRLVQPQFPATAPFPPAATQVPGGPLAGFEQSYTQVMLGAQPHGPRRESVVGAMAKGAVYGFMSWLVWQGMKRRKATKGEYTTPTFRFFGIWWAFMIAGFGLSMEWPLESGWFPGVAFVIGTALSVAYLVYRARGHGRYNTNRQGSPWRHDHRSR
jgi:hypothetical protein